MQLMSAIIVRIEQGTNKVISSAQCIMTGPRNSYIISLIAEFPFLPTIHLSMNNHLVMNLYHSIKIITKLLRPAIALFIIIDMAL